jgi:hypothetical protein
LVAAAVCIASVWGASRVVVDNDFMKDRLDNQSFRLREDLHELILTPGAYARWQAWSTEHAYFLQAWVQNCVDKITWLGAYEQFMAEGRTPDMPEEQAVREARERANSVVRLSQGGMNPEDVAAYDVGTPWHRTWTQFQSYFNVVLNQLLGRKGAGEVAKAAVFSFIIPMILAEAIAKSLWGTWDDEDEDGHVDEAMDVTLGAVARGGALKPWRANRRRSLWRKATRRAVITSPKARHRRPPPPG